jgi:hypothetical protein
VETSARALKPGADKFFHVKALSHSTLAPPLGISSTSLTPSRPLPKITDRDTGTGESFFRKQKEEKNCNSWRRVTLRMVAYGAIPASGAPAQQVSGEADRMPQLRLSLAAAAAVGRLLSGRRRTDPALGAAESRLR